MKKQSLIKGTFILGVAGIIAKFLGLFFRWPLQMLIGDEGIGYYQMSYPLYMFFIAAASGIPVAVSKLVSERNAVRDEGGIISVLKEAMIFMFIMGMGFTIILLLFSKDIIRFLKWDTRSYYSLIGISLAPLFISIMSVFRGFFQGMQNMNYTAISQLIEQLGRVIFGVGLAYILLPKGIEYSAGGAAIGAAAGGLLGGIYLFLKYLGVKKEFRVKKVKRNFKIMNTILYTAIPISIGSAVGTIMSLIDSALVPQKLLEAGFTYKQSTILYGQLTGKAFTLVNVPLTLSVSLCAALVPIIAEDYILNRKMAVLKKVELAIKISMVIAVPSCLGLNFMAKPILNLIFPGQEAGYEILKHLALSIPFIVLCQTSTAILQGIGRYIRPIINLCIGCILKIVITLILVPMNNINIYGAVIGTIAGYVISAILNMMSLKRSLNISINYYEIMIKPLIASTIMIIAVVFIYFYAYNYTISSKIACLIAVFLGMIIYFIIIGLIGILDYNYIKRKIIKR
ncbi:stage V sporulation protein B [Clostridium botulinum]|uniref:Stage V sporulation protein B n=1 Tax=Clostridium botulinum (strain Hall / ATCC 3502 / NCTC 13319 / Type A) TaxID=441771 RepID=A5I7R1_CLOBH|nr:polysaccharide biosynthesis protein [Clostridium botulinum]ABS35345.1 putative stage V sporulation protein B [Clostridium botulinum A str. ATCC 19397]ABS38039.1 putative stage V sporulation protein B [Clostridium botulinum A str. Hall]AUM89559.1 stage V sporulation protein B [Clostridium botulinum]AUN12524.1 stage V sporulation protein B [Clostridium botulinum]AUN23514.1 stage V sporulation protein B [Clostridium botulinum]